MAHLGFEHQQLELYGTSYDLNDWMDGDTMEKRTMNKTNSDLIGFVYFDLTGSSGPS